MHELKSFKKIQRIENLSIAITQKIHGTNAQILVYEKKDGTKDLACASRSRWIIPGDDNHGFAKFCHKRKAVIIDALGLGRHYGEWAGPGIQAGEGLKEKNLFLFNWRRFNDIELPENISCVPVVHYENIREKVFSSRWDLTGIQPTGIQEAINLSMEYLKINGSLICPGYMKPEGIVIDIDGTLYKKTFENEETCWKVKEKIPVDRVSIDVNYLLQPRRLDKLLGRDEKYLREFPKTLSSICKDYVADLESEGQILGTEDEIKEIKKALGREVFKFVKSKILGENHESIS